MTRDRSEDVEPHVFDQTNGVVDLGTDASKPPAAEDLKQRTTAGFAMLSTQKP